MASVHDFRLANRAGSTGTIAAMQKRPANRTAGQALGSWYFADKSLEPGQGHPWGRHSHAVVTLVLHGTLEEGFDRQIQRCDQFQLHYKPAGEPHVTRTRELGVRMFLLGLRNPELFERHALGPTPRGIDDGVGAAVALRSMLEIGDAAESIAPRESIKRILGCIRGSECPAGRSPPTWLTELREMIERQVGEYSSLDALGAAFRVHPVYMARAFRRHYGQSIGALRRYLRCGRAVQSLAQGVAPADVAQLLGYADQSHLTRELRQETGWTPAHLASSIRSLGRPAADV